MDNTILQHTVYAKIGELVQGKISPTTSFLITNQSAKNLYTTTKLIKTERSSITLNTKAYHALLILLSVTEGCQLSTIKQKSLKSLEHEYHHKLQTLFAGFSIIQYSNIPEGKGLSSSSADILSVLLAVDNYLKANTSAELIYQIAAMADPTDPCLSPQLMVFDQHSGNVLEQLPQMDYNLIYFDSDANTIIDTVALAATVKYGDQEYAAYNLLLTEFKKAVEQKSYNDFFRLTIKSALLNQQYLCHYQINLLIAFAELHQTGVFIAHSGTYMGLILKPDQAEILHEKAITFIQQNWNTQAYYQ